MQPHLISRCTVCDAPLDETGACGDCFEMDNFTDLEAQLAAVLGPQSHPQLLPTGV